MVVNCQLVKRGQEKKSNDQIYPTGDLHNCDVTPFLPGRDPSWPARQVLCLTSRCLLTFKSKVLESRAVEPSRVDCIFVWCIYGFYTTRTCISNYINNVHFIEYSSMPRCARLHSQQKAKVEEAYMECSVYKFQWQDIRAFLNGTVKSKSQVSSLKIHGRLAWHAV